MLSLSKFLTKLGSHRSFLSLGAIAAFTLGAVGAFTLGGGDSVFGKEVCKCIDGVKVGVATQSTSAPSDQTVACSNNNGTISVTAPGGNGNTGGGGTAVNCFKQTITGLPYHPSYQAAPADTCQGVKTETVTWHLKDYTARNGQPCYIKTSWPCPSFPWLLPCQTVKCANNYTSTDKDYKDWVGADSSACNWQEQ